MDKIKVILVGAGGRGTTYVRIMKQMPEKYEVVGVADPIQSRRENIKQMHNLPDSACYNSWEEILAQPKMADLAIIGTMDEMHTAPALRAIELGYHLLLEKPAARTVGECRHIAEVAEENGLHVVVCHVLRYTVFYQTIRQLLRSGRIGEVMSVEAIERVAYWHQAHSFVRGNWHVAADTTPMILAKCCHDMDMILWLTGKKCERVTSFGHLSHFTAENMPQGAPERCSDACPMADKCVYNAERYYLDRFRKYGDIWPVNVVAPEPTEEKIRAALKTGDYGRCVYRMNNDVVDHQVLNLQLEDDVTVAFTMTAFTATGGRVMRICGTAGEIFADMERNIIRVMEFGKEPVGIDVRKLTDDFSGHGGGDGRMIADYLDLLEGKGMNPSLTTIARSVESHYVALAAEESRTHGGQVVVIDEFAKA